MLSHSFGVWGDECVERSCSFLSLCVVSVCMLYVCFREMLGEGGPARRRWSSNGLWVRGFMFALGWLLLLDGRARPFTENEYALMFVGSLTVRTHTPHKHTPRNKTT